MLALVGGLVPSAKSSTGETLVCSAAVRNLGSQSGSRRSHLHHQGPNTALCLFLQPVIVILEE